MASSTLLTTTPSTRKGDVYATTFKFELDNALSFNSIYWSFGDGNDAYNKSVVEHVYNYPGLYTVGLSAWTKNGSLYTDTSEIDVDYVYKDAVFFSQVPSINGMVGMPSPQPFTVNVVSSKLDTPLRLILQALNTESVPNYSIKDKKWNKIIPSWKFVDAETNKIIDNNEITLTTTPIYKNSTVIAVSGKTSFYFIDDLPTADWFCPLIVTATLSTHHFVYPLESLVYPYHSYSNSDVTRAAISWQIQNTYPTQLFVTENFINDIYPVKWSNTPIPVLVTCKFYPEDVPSFASALGYTSTDVLSYPQTNAIGNQAKLKLTLVDEFGNLIPEHLYTVETNNTSYAPSAAPLFFQKTDSNGNLNSGYVFTTITPLTSFPFKTKVQAQTLLFTQLTSSSVGGTAFPFPDSLPIYGDGYVSHPLKSKINKIKAVTFSGESCSSVRRYKALNMLNSNNILALTTPTTIDFDLSQYALSGTSGVYAMAFHPLKNTLYAADADQDTILTFNYLGDITNTIYLSTYTNNSYNVPSYISIDGHNNIYVSLYGNQSVLKFDDTFNLLFSALPASFAPLTANAFGSPFVAPPTVETDSQNDFWVSYCHPLSSKLIKFAGTNGAQLFEASGLSLSSVPVSIAIDIFDNVWVACYDSNQLQCYSSVNGSQLYDLSFFTHPSYISIDRNNRIWVLHGYDKCSVYNPFTNTLSSWSFSNPIGGVSSVSNTYTALDDSNAATLNPLWGGLAVDVYDRVWAIDTVNNKVYTFDSSNPTSTYLVTDVIPSSTSFPTVTGGSSTVSIVNALNVQSAQAAGDWTGNRWYQIHSTVTPFYPVSGTSQSFQVYDIENSYRITKVNEEFNTAQYLNDLALPEILKNNTELFDKFFAAVIGDGNPTKESIGRVVYERIANFVQTHGDFETSEVNQLLSFAAELGVKTEKFGNFFPAEVERLLNLFSVNKHFLRGRKKYNESVSETLGNVLTETSLVTANTFIYLQDKRRSAYNLVFVNPLSSVDVYPLSAIEIEGIKTPLLENYYVFEYIKSEAGYVNNIINWDSIYTTVSYDLSTNDQWYGEEGLVDIMFNNLLTKRLFHVD